MKQVTYKKKEIEVTNPYNKQQKELVIVEYKEETNPVVWTFGDIVIMPNIEICSWSLLDEDPPTWMTDELIEVTFYDQNIN
jgi:hypothetical protein